MEFDTIISKEYLLFRKKVLLTSLECKMNGYISQNKHNEIYGDKPLYTSEDFEELSNQMKKIDEMPIDELFENTNYF